MSGSFDEEHVPAVVPDGVVTIIPRTAIVAGGDVVRIMPTHKILWAILRNLSGTVEIRLANTVEGLSEGVWFPWGAATPLNLSAIGATRELVLSVDPAGADGSFAALVCLERRKISDAMPELLSDEGFPAYEANSVGGELLITPGVDTTP